MRTDDTTIPALYAQAVYDILADYGHNAAAIFDRPGLGIPADMDAHMQVPIESFRQLLLDGASLTEARSFGLQIGQRLLVTHHGVLSAALLTSPSLRDLTRVIKEFLLLRTDLFSMENFEDRDRYRIILVPRPDLQDAGDIVIQIAVMALKNVVDFLLMGASSVDYVALGPSASGATKAVEEYLNCPVIFDGDWQGLSLRPEQLDQPLHMRNSRAFVSATNQCLQELEIVQNTATLSGHVAKMILAGIGNFPSLDTVAANLNMTPRSLHRKLLAENSSFQGLLDQVKEDLAARYLADPGTTVSEISYMLGYADSASFRKAFKRWKGMPPQTYRDSLKAQDG